MEKKNGISLLYLIIVIILRQYKPEFAVYASMLGGAIIILLSLI